MSNGIYIPTADELAKRISRYDALQPMSTSNDLDWMPQGAKDVIFARKIMPVILEDTKNPFGNVAPIFGASGTTMFISVLPPGQGPCLHSHNSTFETFTVLEGSIEFQLGDPVAHRIVLNKWDTLSCPPRVYRGFRNVGTADAVLQTIITGLVEARDDVTVPSSVAEGLARDYGDKVVDAFKGLLTFDPPPARAG